MADNNDNSKKLPQDPKLITPTFEKPDPLEPAQSITTPSAVIEQTSQPKQTVKSSILSETMKASSESKDIVNQISQAKKRLLDRKKDNIESIEKIKKQLASSEKDASTELLIGAINSETQKQEKLKVEIDKFNEDIRSFQSKKYSLAEERDKATKEIRDRQLIISTNKEIIDSEESTDEQKQAAKERIKTLDHEVKGYRTVEADKRSQIASLNIKIKESLGQRDSSKVETAESKRTAREVRSELRQRQDLTNKITKADTQGQRIDADIAYYEVRRKEAETAKAEGMTPQSFRREFRPGVSVDPQQEALKATAALGQGATVSERKQYREASQEFFQLFNSIKATRKALADLEEGTTEYTEKQKELSQLEQQAATQAQRMSRVEKDVAIRQGGALPGYMRTKEDGSIGLNFRQIGLDMAKTIAEAVPAAIRLVGTAVRASGQPAIERYTIEEQKKQEQIRLRALEASDYENRFTDATALLAAGAGKLFGMETPYAEEGGPNAAINKLAEDYVQAKKTVPGTLLMTQATADLADLGVNTGAGAIQGGMVAGPLGAAIGGGAEAVKGVGRTVENALGTIASDPELMSMMNTEQIVDPITQKVKQFQEQASSKDNLIVKYAQSRYEDFDKELQDELKKNPNQKLIGGMDLDPTRRKNRLSTIKDFQKSSGVSLHEALEMTDPNKDKDSYSLFTKAKRFFRSEEEQKKIDEAASAAKERMSDINSYDKSQIRQVQQGVGAFVDGKQVPIDPKTGKAMIGYSPAVAAQKGTTLLSDVAGSTVTNATQIMARSSEAMKEQNKLIKTQRQMQQVENVRERLALVHGTKVQDYLNMMPIKRQMQQSLGVQTAAERAKSEERLDILSIDKDFSDLGYTPEDVIKTQAQASKAFGRHARQKTGRGETLLGEQAVRTALEAERMGMGESSQSIAMMGAMMQAGVEDPTAVYTEAMRKGMMLGIQDSKEFNELLSASLQTADNTVGFEGTLKSIMLGVGSGKATDIERAKTAAADISEAMSGKSGTFMDMIKFERTSEAIKDVESAAKESGIELDEQDKNSMLTAMRMRPEDIENESVFKSFLTLPAQKAVAALDKKSGSKFTERLSQISRIAGILAPAVEASGSKDIADLQNLLIEAQSSDPAKRGAAQKKIQERYGLQKGATEEQKTAGSERLQKETAIVGGSIQRFKTDPDKALGFQGMLLGSISEATGISKKDIRTKAGLSEHEPHYEEKKLEDAQKEARKGEAASDIAAQGQADVKRSGTGKVIQAAGPGGAKLFGDRETAAARFEAAQKRKEDEAKAPTVDAKRELSPIDKQLKEFMEGMKELKKAFAEFKVNSAALTVSGDVQINGASSIKGVVLDGALTAATSKVGGDIVNAIEKRYGTSTGPVKNSMPSQKDTGGKTVPTPKGN